MKITSSLCALVATFAVHGTASADLILFTDVEAFNSATEQRAVETNSAPPNGFRNRANRTYRGITYPNYAFMVDPGYAPDLYDWGTGAVLLLDADARLAFSPTFAFAADFGTLHPGSPIFVTIDGETTIITTAPTNTFNFYGWVSDTPFESVRLTTDADFMVLDNVTRAGAIDIPPPVEVPEPGSLALLGIAAWLLAHRRHVAVS